MSVRGHVPITSNAFTGKSYPFFWPTADDFYPDCQLLMAEDILSYVLGRSYQRLPEFIHMM